MSGAGLPGDARRAYAGRKRSSNPYLIPITLVGAAALFGQTFWLQGHQRLFRPFSVDRLTCEHCGGAGVVRDGAPAAALVLCPACYGVGAHWVRRLDESDQLCPACAGAGRLAEPEGGAWRTCRRCDGRGLIRSQPWSTKDADMFNEQDKPKAPAAAR